VASTPSSRIPAGTARLGSRFGIRAFHGSVLGSGAVPLGVLDQVVTRWAGETG
jgi:uncharacterized protein (DUF885 family)